MEALIYVGVFFSSRIFVIDMFPSLRVRASSTLFSFSPRSQHLIRPELEAKDDGRASTISPSPTELIVSKHPASDTPTLSWVVVEIHH